MGSIPNSITLAPEQTAQIKLPPGSKLQESCTTARFKQGGPGLVVIQAQKQGTCYYHIRAQKQTRTYKVNIKSWDFVRTLESIQFILEHHPGLKSQLKIRDENTYILMEGTLRDLSSAKEFMRTLYPLENTVNRVSLSESVRDALIHEINGALKDAGYSDLRVSFVTVGLRSYWRLEGTVSLRDPTQEPGGWLAHHYWPMKEHFSRLYHGKPQFIVSMEFHELRNSLVRHLGVAWPDLIKLIFQGTHFNRSDALHISAHHTQTNLFSKLLAHPKITCLDGQKAVFHSGGSFPVKQEGRWASKIEWQQHGLRVTVIPTWDEAKHRVRGALDVSYTQPLHEQSTDPIPSLTKSSLRTTFLAHEAEPLILTGFSKTKESRTRHGIPWTQNIPWVRLFAGHTKDEMEEADLLIRVNVSIKRPQILGLQEAAL